MKAGIAVFAGAGPGAPDLVTLRCKEAISEADLIIYAGSLVNPEVLKYAKGSCEILDSAPMALEEIVSAMAKAAKAGRKVLRLHTGDPAVYGAIGEQMRELDKLGVAYEVIPGVSSVFASAAALKTELTAPGISQTVILTRMAGRTPVPEGQDLKSLAAHKATMAIFLSVPDISAIVAELLDGGYPETTAAAIVHRASWPEEGILRGTLADIAAKAKEAKLSRQAMIIVGDALRNEGGNSLLYDASFTHGWRKASAPEKESPKAQDAGAARGTAVYAITRKGVETALKVGASLEDAKLFVPERFAQDAPGSQSFGEGELGAVLKANWSSFKAHVFVMSAGIVVRKIAPLLKSKLQDPAVVVCDEMGLHCISLAGGHIGGANRLTSQIAGAIGADPVITTATDVQGFKAFDELAAEEGWEIANPKMIKRLNSLLLEDAKIAAVLPQEVFDAHYASCPKIRNFASPEEIGGGFDGAVVLSAKPSTEALKIPCLALVKR